MQQDSGRQIEAVARLNESMNRIVDSVDAIVESARQVKECSDVIGKKAAQGSQEMADNTSHFTDITYNLERVIVEQKSAVDAVKSDLEPVDQIAGNNAETAKQTNASCEDFTKQPYILAEFVAHVKIRGV